VGVHILIRGAEPGDVEQMPESLGVEQHAYFYDRLLLQKDGRGAVLLAFDVHRPIGGVFVSWDEADEPEVRKHLSSVPMIFHLYVAPDYRHRGVGRLLMQAAEGVLRRRGYTSVLLGVDKSNEVARRLYEWLGYVQPHEPELSDLRAAVAPSQPERSVGEAYDILVADLRRPAPNRPESA
jgi:ribosomal protein S18 acetylase RimI-like enzyme